MDHLDRQACFITDRADGGGSYFSAVIRLQSGDPPTILCKRKTRDAVAGAEIQQRFATTRTQQARDFSKLFTLSKTFRRAEHRQVKIVVPNLGFVVRLGSIPSDSFFPGQPTH